MITNEFYSISEINSQPIDEYQLENLGIERETIAWGKRVRDGYGGYTYQRGGITQKVKSEDYDGSFAFKLSHIKPPYELDKLLNYHLNFYTIKGGDRSKFLKHIKYTILPLIQKRYSDADAHIALIEEWLLENTKVHLTMIEYSELTQEERKIINDFIQSVPAKFHQASHIAFNKTDIDNLIKDNVSYLSERVINFLLANDFIKLWTYKPSYEILSEGRRLLQYGSIEKYYEKRVQNNASIIGNGNIVNIASGSIHQSGITINSNQNHYEQLKNLGVEEAKIEELKEIISKNKSDRSTLTTQVFKWLGDVTKAVATKGLTDHLPQITQFISHLIN